MSEATIAQNRRARHDYEVLQRYEAGIALTGSEIKSVREHRVQLQGSYARLRDGELSMLYPIIALTYVWVNLLSMYFFHEHLNPWKGLGIALVIGGVALLGKASRR